MLFSDAYDIIKARIEERWAILHADIPLVFTNEQRPTFDQAKRCIHVEIRMGAPRTAAWGGYGNNRQRQSGEVIFRCFGPSDIKMGELNRLADDCCGILRYWPAPNDLRFFDAGPTGGGEDDKSGVFYEQDAIASFTLDTIG